VRGRPESELDAGLLCAADVESLIAEARFGRTQSALARLEEAIPALERAGEPQVLLLGLFGRCLLLRGTCAPAADVLAVCDLLERAALEHRDATWTATACALRALTRLDGADFGAAMNDLARVDLEQVTAQPQSASGARLLEVLALAYARLRLYERLDDVRARLEEGASALPAVDRAAHWSTWCAELAWRAMEPIAGGATEPDQHLLGRALDVAGRLATVPGEAVPPRMRRIADGVRALAAAFRGKPAEALRLLGQDAFGEPRDLPPLERQLVLLAAIHAHTLVGSLATARGLDDAAAPSPPALPHLMLDVCRARERLWLETHAGGEVLPVMHRLTELLTLLGRQGMDLVAETARQALEHQALRTESRTDALTGVGNRRALDEQLRHLLRFGPLPVALVLVDIDDFKRVNDRFTHVVGDEVLRRAAASLSEQLRTGDRLLRYGGDEFVVLLPRTGDQEAAQVAARMARAISPLPGGGLAEGLTVAVPTGSAALWSLTGRRPDRDAEQLFRRADEALLDGKRRRGALPSPSHSLPVARGRRAATRGHLVAPDGSVPDPSVPDPSVPDRSVPDPSTTPVAPVRRRPVVIDLAPPGRDDRTPFG
jgi:diguanylate cyclase (GGDEF)-like protein